MSSRPRLLLVAPSEMTHSPAFDRALALAKAMNATLTLVAFVYLDGLQQLDLLDADRQAEIREAYLQRYRQWLEQEAEAMRGEGVEVTTEVKWDQPSLSALSGYVRSQHPDLLIKDAHQESALKRIFFTPLDWRLLCDSRAPIHLVTAQGMPIPRKVLACVDVLRDDVATRELNDRIIDQAARFATHCKCPLHLLGVYDWTALYLADIGIGKVPVSVSPSYDERKAKFLHLADKHALHKDNRHFIVGTPGKAIVEFVGQDVFDVLVIGTVTHRSLNKLLGSTTESLLYQPPCSLLVIKPVELPDFAQ
ncbi:MULTISPECIES: universal stress protein [Pseudomonas]|uniref:Universal stress protein n=1 Tax=Pseudomonas gingeri TaxID=117681 RepID=A0A7Y7WU98_9PSED|nr:MULTISPECIES: universal stress protein [Pseudomonas]NWB87834.1 universal stress protein [Pseudomonas gingeri]